MRSRITVAALLVALAGCAVEHGNPPPERAAAARSPHAAGDSAPGPMHSVFDRRVDTVAPGVSRAILRVVLRSQVGREAARAALEAVADVARRDTAIAAVRVLGYLPPAPGHGDQGGPGLVPFAYLEWVPAGGWDDVTARTARAAHHTDVVFVGDLPAHPGTEGSGRRGGPQ